MVNNSKRQDDSEPQYGVRLEGKELKDFQEKNNSTAHNGKSKEGLQFGVFPLNQALQGHVQSTPTEKPTQPVQVKYAWWSWAFATVLIIFSLFEFVRQFPQLTTILEQKMNEVATEQGLTKEQLIDALRNIMPIFVGALFLCYLFLLFCGFRMQQGKHWARIVVTLICVLRVTTFFLSLLFLKQLQVTSDTILGMITNALALVTLFFMWTAPAKEYFDKMHIYFAAKKAARYLKK